MRPSYALREQTISDRRISRRIVEDEVSSKLIDALERLALKRRVGNKLPTECLFSDVTLMVTSSRSETELRAFNLDGSIRLIKHQHSPRIEVTATDSMGVTLGLARRLNEERCWVLTYSPATSGRRAVSARPSGHSSFGMKGDN